MHSLFLQVGNYGTSTFSRCGRNMLRPDDKFSCRLIHTFMLKVLTNLEPRETKIPVSVCVFKGITRKWVMNAALLMTLPTPQLLNLSARQNELQTSPRCQEHLISTPWSWWSLTGFQTWHPPSNWGAYAGSPRKNLFPAPCVMWPTHILSMASCPVWWNLPTPSNCCSTEFTFKSWSCSKESCWMSECMQRNVNHRERGNFCNLNILAICLLAFSLMD